MLTSKSVLMLANGGKHGETTRNMGVNSKTGNAATAAFSGRT
jgi:hypothetical protein